MSFMDFVSDFTRESNYRVYGVVVGIVTNNQDPEKLGRVKLKLPVRLGENETDWARVATPMSGKGIGVFFLPEVGDEVLVMFNEGSIREPFVIGSLWNSEETPPETNEDGKNSVRLIKSKDEHSITITDGDEGAIEIMTKNGNVIKIDDSGNGKIEIADKSGADKILIDGDGKSVQIAGDGKVEIKAKSSTITVDGNGNAIELKSSAKLAIQAAQIEIKAQGTLDLKSDGMINIKGSMVKIN